MKKTITPMQKLILVSLLLTVSPSLFVFPGTSQSDSQPVGRGSLGRGEDTTYDDVSPLTVLLDPIEAFEPGQETPVYMTVRSELDTVTNIALRVELPPLISFIGEVIGAFGAAGDEQIVPQVVRRRSGYTYIKLRDTLFPEEEKSYAALVVFDAVDEATTEINVRAIRLSQRGIPDFRTVTDAFTYFHVTPDLVLPLSADELSQMNQDSLASQFRSSDDEVQMLSSKKLPGIPVNDKVMAVAPDFSQDFEDPFNLPMKRLTAQVALVEPDTIEDQAAQLNRVGISDDQPGEEAADEILPPTDIQQQVKRSAPDNTRPSTTEQLYKRDRRDPPQKPTAPRSQR